MDGEGGVVRFNNCVRNLRYQVKGRETSKSGVKDRAGTRSYLRAGDHRVGVHDPVRILLPDLRDEERAHTGACAASERVCQLEALETVAALGLLPDNVQNTVHKFGALSVVTLG